MTGGTSDHGDWFVVFRWANWTRKPDVAGFGIVWKDEADAVAAAQKLLQAGNPKRFTVVQVLAFGPAGVRVVRSFLWDSLLKEWLTGQPDLDPGLELEEEEEEPCAVVTIPCPGCGERNRVGCPVCERTGQGSTDIERWQPGMTPGTVCWIPQNTGVCAVPRGWRGSVGWTDGLQVSHKHCLAHNGFCVADTDIAVVVKVTSTAGMRCPFCRGKSSQDRQKSGCPACGRDQGQYDPGRISWWPARDGKLAAVPGSRLIPETVGDWKGLETGQRIDLTDEDGGRIVQGIVASVTDDGVVISLP